MICCKFCHQEMKVSPESFRENPFCRRCLHRRLEKSKAAVDSRLGPIVGLKREGCLMSLIREPLVNSKPHVFYLDDHSCNDTALHCGAKDNPEEVATALGHYLKAAIETAEGSFECSIIFKDMTEAEVEAMPEV